MSMLATSLKLIGSYVSAADTHLREMDIEKEGSVWWASAAANVFYCTQMAKHARSAETAADVSWMRTDGSLFNVSWMHLTKT